MASNSELYCLIKERYTLETEGNRFLKIGSKRQRLCALKTEAVKPLKEEIREIETAGMARKIFYDLFQEGRRKRQRVSYYEDYQKRKKQWEKKAKQNDFIAAFNKLQAASLGEALLDYVEQRFHKEKYQRKAVEFKNIRKSLSQKRASRSLWEIVWEQFISLLVPMTPAKLDHTIIMAKERLLLFVASKLDRVNNLSQIENKTSQKECDEILKDSAKELQPEDQKTFQENLKEYCNCVFSLLAESELQEKSIPTNLGRNSGEMSDHPLQITKISNTTQPPKLELHQGIPIGGNELEQIFEVLKQDLLKALNSDKSTTEIEKLRKKASRLLHPDKNFGAFQHSDRLFKEFMNFFEGQIEQRKNLCSDNLDDELRKAIERLEKEFKERRKECEKLRKADEEIEQKLSEQQQQLSEQQSRLESAISQLEKLGILLEKLEILPPQQTTENPPTQSSRNTNVEQSASKNIPETKKSSAIYSQVPQSHSSSNTTQFEINSVSFFQTDVQPSNPAQSMMHKTLEEDHRHEM